MSAAGMAKSILSKRSRMPPCPGSMCPESLMSRWRFIIDSVRSPKVPNTTTTSAMPIHCHAFMKEKKCSTTKALATVAKAPPMAPSHDFLGDIRGKSLCLPLRPKVTPLR